MHAHTFRDIISGSFAEACQRFARTFPLQSVSLCPGDTVNYTCTINDSSQSASVVTTWAGSAFKQCSPSQILLAQRGLGDATDPTSSGRACGNLSAMTTNITGSCLTPHPHPSDFVVTVQWIRWISLKLGHELN